MTFQDGTTVLGTATLNTAGKATFSTSALAVGSHAITASYAGTSTLAASTSGSLSERVNQVATTTTLVATTATQTVGQWVGFLAAVESLRQPPVSPPAP